MRFSNYAIIEFSALLSAESMLVITLSKVSVMIAITRFNRINVNTAVAMTNNNNPVIVSFLYSVPSNSPRVINH